MNNGVFLTLMDIGRYDQGLRTGVWQEWNKRGWFPIVVNSTISYRKALLPWQKFTIETKVIGWDEIAYYIEQRLLAWQAAGGSEVGKGLGCKRAIAKGQGAST